MDGFSLAIARLMVSLAASHGQHHRQFVHPIERPSSPAYLLQAGEEAQRGASPFALEQGKAAPWRYSSVPLQAGPEKGNGTGVIDAQGQGFGTAGLGSAIFRTCFSAG